MQRMKSAVSPAIALAIALIVTAGIADAQTQIKPGFNLFSTQDDVQIGQQSLQQALQQLPIVNDSQINSYVNGIGQRLAAHSGGPNFQYQFRVVNTSDINAFALPGGFVFINRGILEQARNEGELAGVMAHEISHVALRHGTHQASKAYLAQAGISILGGILGGKVGQGTGQIINAVGGLGLNALFLKYSRSAETQADIVGAQIMARAGYDPMEMVNFFETLRLQSGSDPGKFAQFLSDHPNPGNRMQYVNAEIATLPPRSGVKVTSLVMRYSPSASPASSIVCTMKVWT